MLAKPTRPSFNNDILPIFERMTNLQWVNAGFAAGFGFGGVFDFSTPEWREKLADPSPAMIEKRRVLTDGLAKEAFGFFDIPAGELGAWSWNTIWWDGPWGRGSMRVHGSAAWNFDATGRMGVLPDDGQPWQPRAVPGSGQAQDRPARADDRAPQPEAPAFEKPRKGGRARKDGMKPEAVELLRPLPGRVGGTRPVKPRPLPEDDAQTRELPGRVGGTRPVASGTSDDADVFRPTPGRSGGSRPVGAPRNAFSNAVRSGAYAREISERGRESRDRDEDDR